MNKKRRLARLFSILDGHFGDLKWWPAKTSFEVMAGAILTQKTSWKNVEKAILNLRKRKLLVPEKIALVGMRDLSELIKSSGYHRVKAKRLKELVFFLQKPSSGGIKGLQKQNISIIRDKLLKVNGIGPETADVILLYALNKPIFVVDSYTKRIFSRHGLIGKEDYASVQKMVHKYFPMDINKLNQFHALIVETAKNFCRKSKPLCDICPLRCIL